MADRLGGEFNARQLREALMGPRLSESEKYAKFLNSTQYFNAHIDPIRADMAPDYYVHMSATEREDHELEIEFFNAANFKKSPPGGLPPNLESLSKNPDMLGLATPEAKRLYEIPGVRKTLEIYVEVFDSDRQLGIRVNTRGEQEGYSLRTAKNRREVTACREMIRGEIRRDVIAGWRRRGYKLTEKAVVLKCREAEQAACAFAYVGGLFDSLDSRWDDWGRVREMACFNDLVNVPMKFASSPLDALIHSFKKSEEEIAPYGKLGRWAYEMAIQSNGGQPLSIEEVAFLADEIKNPKDYWRVTSNGTSITIPECYPRRLVRSVFEETEVDGRELLDFLRNGEEIPWDDVKDTMWADYSSKLSKAAVISDAFQGNFPIKWGDIDAIRDWAQKILDSLAKFGIRKANSLKRWILYASLGVDTKKREPHLANKNIRLAVVARLGAKWAGYLDREDELLFPWDIPGRFL